MLPVRSLAAGQAPNRARSNMKPAPPVGQTRPPLRRPSFRRSWRLFEWWRLVWELVIPASAFSYLNAKFANLLAHFVSVAGTGTPQSRGCYCLAASRSHCCSATIAACSRETARGWRVLPRQHPCGEGPHILPLRTPQTPHATNQCPLLRRRTLANVRRDRKPLLIGRQGGPGTAHYRSCERNLLAAPAKRLLRHKRKVGRMSRSLGLVSCGIHPHRAHMDAC